MAVFPGGFPEAVRPHHGAGIIQMAAMEQGFPHVSRRYGLFMAQREGSLGSEGQRGVSITFRWPDVRLYSRRGMAKVLRISGVDVRAMQPRQTYRHSRWRRPYTIAIAWIDVAEFLDTVHIPHLVTSLHHLETF